MTKRNRLVWMGIAFGVQAAYWGLLRLGFRRARQRTPAPAPGVPPPLSLVVAARDEAERLPALLDALARQTHPRFEALIVDDASADATPRLVAASSVPEVRLVQVEQPRAPRKKNALAHGVAATSHALLAFTDADCRPPPEWLEQLARHHAAAPSAAVLVGYGPYRRRPGWLNRLVRYETLQTAFFTAAAIGLGRPYMAVGRALSYPRALFDAIGGFVHSQQSLSGDDDLLVQEVARRRAAAVYYLFDARTFVPSEAPSTWQQWFRQKQRHTSAARFYARDVQIHLALFHTTSLLLWLAPLVAGRRGAALLGAKLLLQRLALQAPACVLGEPDLLPRQPLLELLYAAYNLVVAPLGILRRPRRW